MTRPRRPELSRRTYALAFAAALWATAAHASGPGVATAGSLDVQVSGLGPDGALPLKATRDGRNLSPPITWSAAPGAKGYVVMMRDERGDGEAGVHWLVYDIPPEVLALPGGMRNVAAPDKPLGAAQGWNGHGSLGYSGPAGTAGDPIYAYRFEVFALSRLLRLRPGAHVDRLVAAMASRVLAHGEVRATYQPPPQPAPAKP